jgi:hypothetical protein
LLKLLANMPSSDHRHSARLWRAVILASKDSHSEDALLALIAQTGISTLDFFLDDQTLTPLIGACIADSPWLVSKLIELGASPDYHDDSDWTPLHWCCKSNRLECASALLHAGANPNATYPMEGSGCLHFCAQSAAVECARLLMDHGANPNKIDPASGASARHWGAHHIELSLALGDFPVPKPDHFERSILHWAVRQSATDEQAAIACQWWVALGADTSCADQQSRLAVDLARERGFWTCASYLQSLGEREKLNTLTPMGSFGARSTAAAGWL